MKDGLKRFFSIDGAFAVVTTKIFDIAASTIYWLIGCIPIVTIGSSFCGLYNAITKSVREDRDTVTHQFWKAYKRDLKTAIPLWIVYGIVLFVLGFNINFLTRIENLPEFTAMLVPFYMAAAIIILATALYVFPAISRFDMPLRWYFKLAFYLSFRHLPATLLLLLLFAFSVYLTLRLPIFIVIIPGLSVWVSSFLIEPILKKYMPQTEEEEEEPKDSSYRTETGFNWGDEEDKN